MPLWQRVLSWFLPWFDPEVEDAKLAEADRIVAQVGRIESVRIAYRDTGNRMDTIRPDRRVRPR